MDPHWSPTLVPLQGSHTQDQVPCNMHRARGVPRLRSEMKSLRICHSLLRYSQTPQNLQVNPAMAWAFSFFYRQAKNNVHDPGYVPFTDHCKIEFGDGGRNACWFLHPPSKMLSGSGFHGLLFSPSISLSNSFT